jgi:hypothetical protein
MITSSGDSAGAGLTSANRRLLTRSSSAVTFAGWKSVGAVGRAQTRIPVIKCKMVRQLPPNHVLVQVLLRSLGSNGSLSVIILRMLLHTSCMWQAESLSQEGNFPCLNTLGINFLQTRMGTIVSAFSSQYSFEDRLSQDLMPSNAACTSTKSATEGASQLRQHCQRGLLHPLYAPVQQEGCVNISACVSDKPDCFSGVA